MRCRRCKEREAEGVNLCRPCMDARYKRAQKSREKRRDTVFKRCEDCRLSKPLRDFALSTTSKDGHQYRCLKCKRGSVNYGAGTPRVKNRTGDRDPMTYAKLAQRLKAKDVTNAEYQAIRDAARMYGVGESPLLVELDPDGKRGLCSLAICVCESIADKESEMTLDGLSKTVGAAKRRIPRKPEGQKEAA